MGERYVGGNTIVGDGSQYIGGETVSGSKFADIPTLAPTLPMDKRFPIPTRGHTTYIGGEDIKDSKFRGVFRSLY